MKSLAAAAASGRPKTGAATKRCRAFACAVASRSDSATLIVLMEMWIAPSRSARIMPSSPNTTASTLASSASIVMTASPPQASRTRVAARAPCSTRGRARLGVRL